MSARGLTQRFVALRKDAQRIAPGMPVHLWLADDDYFPNKRDYAFCLDEHGTKFIAGGRKLLRANPDRQEAILRHEFGHALDYHLGKKLDAMYRGLPQTAERRADAIAEAVWGDRILYDKDTVQSLRHGVFPRPRRLGL
jgi:hypothetical protein